MNNIISIISQDSATVLIGGRPFTVASDHREFEELKQAIAAGDYEAAERIVTMSDRLTKVLGTFGDVQVFAGHVTFQGRQVTNYVVGRMIELVQKGVSPESHARFLDRAMRNPDKTAAADLFSWLERCRMPLAPDGRIIAWKVVNPQFMDKHTGTMNNAPGSKPWMKRENCDPNRHNHCSRGLHFCGPSYIGTFRSNGDHVVAVILDPADVTSFPQDDTAKGRACTYEILFEVEHAGVDTFYQGKDQIVFDAWAYFEKEYPIEVVEKTTGEIWRRFKTREEASAYSAPEGIDLVVVP